jgi:hypothetical protein
MWRQKAVEVLEEQIDLQEVFQGDRFPLIAENRILSGIADTWLHEEDKTDDSLLYQQIRIFENKVAKLGNEPKPEAIRSLLVYPFLHDLITRGSDHMTGYIDDETWFDEAVDFCAYLDQVLPISDEDSVTPHTGDPEKDDTKLYWMDFVESETRTISSYKSSHGESARLTEDLADYNEKTRWHKMRDIGALMLGSGLIATAETVVNSNDTVEWQSLTNLAGAACFAAAAFDALIRNSEKAELKNSIEKARLNEKIEDILPRMNLPRDHGVVDFGDAIELAQLKYKRVEVDADMESFLRPAYAHHSTGPHEKFDRKLAIGTVAFQFSDLYSFRSPQESLAWATLKVVTELIIKGNDLQLENDPAQRAADFLTHAFPLMQGRQTRVRPDADTGLKTWRGYLRELADPTRPQMLRILAETVHYPSSMLPEYTKVGV